MFAAQSLVVGTAAHCSTTFRCQHNTLACIALTQPVPHNLFCSAHHAQIATQRVHIGGVEEVDASLICHVHNCKRGFLISLIAKSHGPQTDFAYFETSTA